MSTPESPVSAGTTKPAGEGLSDEEAVEEVADQTSPDQKAEDVFEREADGASTDAPVEDATADDVAE
jgi:protease I